MAYIIAKPALYGASYVVTAIRLGGLRIDNTRHDPDARFDARLLARQFKSLSAAERALHQMREVGGFDDYEIVPFAASHSKELIDA